MSALQTTRNPATRQAAQHIVDMLVAVNVDGQQAIDILSALADALAGSVYSEHGSVDLGDVADQMLEELIAFEEPEHCGACNGCGEGQHDGSRCNSCGGHGVHPSPKQVAERALREVV